MDGVNQEQTRSPSQEPPPETHDGSGLILENPPPEKLTKTDDQPEAEPKTVVPEKPLKTDSGSEAEPKALLPAGPRGTEGRSEAEPGVVLPEEPRKTVDGPGVEPKDVLPEEPRETEGGSGAEPKDAVPKLSLGKEKRSEASQRNALQKPPSKENGAPETKFRDAIPAMSPKDDHGRENKSMNHGPESPKLRPQHREASNREGKRARRSFPKHFESEDEGEEARPLQLLNIKDNHTFELNEEEMAKFLLREDVKDLHVVIVSVAGAFRKGKSFLLDFFLKYLRAGGEENWMGDENSPLTGFVWRGGCERDTSGILVWNEIFRVETPSGDVGVILMDTQGSFDSGSTVRECATIFALSTMTSSVQVYNLSQNIQEDDLQHLQLFTEYGRLAISEGDYEGTPFQKLVFLVRDWSYPYEASYGREGGKELLERRLQVSDKQHEELQLIRQHIRSCFASIDCFLLPHPGLIVATAPLFDGRAIDIDKEFLVQLKILVPFLLAPENLTIKEINGRKVTCQELLEYIRAYVKVFGSNELPEPKSILMATAEANNLAAVAVCREFYNNSMEEVCGGGRPYMNPSDLEAHHLLCRESTKEKFESSRKMGGEEFSQAYLEKLLNDLDEDYSSFRKHNERKNLFIAIKTPACLLTAVVGSYFFSGVFSLCRIHSIANLCTLLTGFLTTAAVAWSYIKYSGEYRFLEKNIDLGADLLYSHVLRPIHEVASPKLLALIEPTPGRRSESAAPLSTTTKRQSNFASRRVNRLSLKNPTRLASPRGGKIRSRNVASGLVIKR